MIPPQGNGDFAAAMERVLDVYRRPFDPVLPVLCMDETRRQRTSSPTSPSATPTPRGSPNLNTHRPGALYESFPPAEAKALWDRFEFVHTPRHGSWLNVAEIELNVLIRQCLNRRIDSIEVLGAEVAAWQACRDRIQAKVDWQFTTDDARIRLKRLYPTFDE